MADIEEFWDIYHFIKCNGQIIDVRSPLEYEQGHIPRSINLPILDNNERHIVGKCYKEKGKQKAIELAHTIVSGENKKSKILSWLKAYSKNSKTKVICFRGGLRSQTATKWIHEFDTDIQFIKGGYKSFRQAAINYHKHFLDNSDFIVVSGKTGSAKTTLIASLVNKNRAIDLESLAVHRGSAFGGLNLGQQPSQANFENSLAFCMADIYQNKKNHFFIEDESRMIGRIVLGESLFLKMRRAPIVWIETPLEHRIDNILNEYVETPLMKINQILEFADSAGLTYFLNIEQSFKQISKKLGFENFDRIQKMLNISRNEWIQNKTTSSNRDWIRVLLQEYYDPLYLKSMAKRNPEILIKGGISEVQEFCYSYKTE